MYTKPKPYSDHKGRASARSLGGAAGTNWNRAGCCSCSPKQWKLLGHDGGLAGVTHTCCITMSHVNI
jgi:hypothetical protein